MYWSKVGIAGISSCACAVSFSCGLNNSSPVGSSNKSYLLKLLDPNPKGPENREVRLLRFQVVNFEKADLICRIFVYCYCCITL